MHRAIVVRTIDRADPATVAALGAAGVATVHEAAGQTGLLDPGISAIQHGTRIGGSAVTVSCAPGDNMMIHAAVEVVGEGDMLVVAVDGGPTTDGMFGELLAVSLQARGCAGLVIDAAVRDVADLRSMGFPVWSRTIHARGTAKAVAGSVNTPVAVGGVAIDPGDVIVADDDGVMVVPRASAEAVRRASAERIDNELVSRRRLADGELGVDFYGLRERLESLGVRWVDRLDDVP